MRSPVIIRRCQDGDDLQGTKIHFYELCRNCVGMHSDIIESSPLILRTGSKDTAALGF